MLPFCAHIPVDLSVTHLSQTMRWILCQASAFLYTQKAPASDATKIILHLSRSPASTSLGLPSGWDFYHSVFTMEAQLFIPHIHCLYLSCLSLQHPAWLLQLPLLKWVSVTGSRNIGSACLNCCFLNHILDTAWESLGLGLGNLHFLRVSLCFLCTLRSENPG